MPPMLRAASSRPAVLSLTAGHEVRAGPGLDAVHVRAVGRGLLVGPAGVRLVWGALDRWVLRRFDRPRARAVFLGTHGVVWATATLASPGRATAPGVRGLRPPRAPGEPLVVPALAVLVHVFPPEVP
jgi:hypothetical protein